MHITYLTRRYWPAVGGVERVAMTLGDALVPDGHTVTVVAQCIDEVSEKFLRQGRDAGQVLAAKQFLKNDPTPIFECFDRAFDYHVREAIATMRLLNATADPIVH